MPHKTEYFDRLLKKENEKGFIAWSIDVFWNWIALFFFTNSKEATTDLPDGTSGPKMYRAFGGHFFMLRKPCMLDWILLTWTWAVTLSSCMRCDIHFDIRGVRRSCNVHSVVANGCLCVCFHKIILCTYYTYACSCVKVFEKWNNNVESQTPVYQEDQNRMNKYRDSAPSRYSQIK